MLPLLERIIASAAVAGERGHAEAIRAFAELALVEVPRRGVLAPKDPELFAAIDTIARQSLGLENARRELRQALAAVEPFARRDALASAHNQFVSVSDVSYFYVGLSFGITAATMAGR